MPMDAFQSNISGLESPGSRHMAITPSDSADLPVIPRAIYIGGGGTIVIRDKHGTEISYTVADGAVLSFRAVRVLATGTTASSIVGWD